MNLKIYESYLYYIYREWLFETSYNKKSLYSTLESIFFCQNQLVWNHVQFSQRKFIAHCVYTITLQFPTT